MFKRRSSKDLSVKIGYDNINSKGSSKLSSAAAAAAAAAEVGVPISNVRGSFTYDNPPRKSTGTLSPEGAESTDASKNSRGPSPLAALKSFSPSKNGPQQQQAAGGGASSGNAAGSKVPSKSGSKPKGATSSSLVMAEPPSKSLVIGEGVLFEGATEGCDAAVVGGKLLGTVKSQRLEVTCAGRMEGAAIVETAEIAGTFEGKLIATKGLKICSTGRVKGEVSFGSIVVDNGGKIEGKINFDRMRETLPAEDSEPSPPPETAAPVAAPSKKVVTPSAAPAASVSSSSASFSSKKVGATLPTAHGSSFKKTVTAPVTVRATPTAVPAPLNVQLAPESTASTPSEESPVAKLPSVSSAVARLQLQQKAVASGRASPE